MKDLILAGDVGGTKTNLACFTLERGLLDPLDEQTFHTASFPDFESILTRFLGDRADRVAAASFGVAGPVKDGAVQLTNVPWGIDAATVRGHLRTDKIGLINDMMAMAYGVMAIGADRYVVLNAGDPAARGNAALIAAGTGLGEALLHDDHGHWEPSPSEGGHSDFAPTNDIETELLTYLRGRFGRVSTERILSGPGLVNVYQFLRDSGRGAEPQWLAARLATEDPGAVISELALAGQSPLCAQAVEIFVHGYGCEAGNVALKALATGGVFIGGGIAPKLLPKLREATFMAGFLDQRRLRELLVKIPVRVIMEPKAPLYGAAYHASLLLKG